MAPSATHSPCSSRRWRRVSPVHLPSRDESADKMAAGMKQLCFATICVLFAVGLGVRWALVRPKVLLGDSDRRGEEENGLPVLSSLALLISSGYILLHSVCGGIVFSKLNGCEKNRRCISLLGVPTFFTGQAISMSYAFHFVTASAQLLSYFRSSVPKDPYQVARGTRIATAVLRPLNLVHTGNLFMLWWFMVWRNEAYQRRVAPTLSAGVPLFRIGMITHLGPLLLSLLDVALVAPLSSSDFQSLGVGPIDLSISLAVCTFASCVRSRGNRDDTAKSYAHNIHTRLYHPERRLLLHLHSNTSRQILHRTLPIRHLRRKGICILHYSLPHPKHRVDGSNARGGLGTEWVKDRRV